MKWFFLILSAFLASCASNIGKKEASELSYLYGQVKRVGNRWVPEDPVNRQKWVTETLENYDRRIRQAEKKIDRSRFSLETLTEQFGYKSWFDRRKIDKRELINELGHDEAYLDILKRERNQFSSTYKYPLIREIL